MGNFCNYQFLPEGTRPLEHHFATKPGFLISACNQIVFKPIDFITWRNPQNPSHYDQKNYEYIIYRIINCRHSYVGVVPDKEDQNFLQSYTPYFQIQFWDSDGQRYLGLANVTATLEPNPSLMAIDMGIRGSQESYLIIGQRFFDRVSNVYRVYNKDECRCNFNTAVPVLLRFFQNNLCMVYQFRIHLQKIKTWYTNQRNYVFPKSSLLFAYDQLSKEDKVEPTFGEHLKEHRPDANWLKPESISCPRPKVVLKIVGLDNAHYYDETDEEFGDVEKFKVYYLKSLEDLLNAMMTAEQKLLWEMGYRRFSPSRHYGRW